MRSEVMDRNWLELGLIGYPVSHSLSPRLHLAALQALGLAGRYQLYPVPPMPEGEELLAGLLQRISDRQISGLNVTVPHKETVAEKVDRLTPQAQAMGAINTLYVADGRLVGDNTDAQGFWIDLSRQMPPDVRWNTALILGAGGSARAVAYILNQHGYRLAIASRRMERAQKLAHRLELSACTVDDFTPSGLERLLASLGQTPDLIVNCTPLGMHPNNDQSSWPAGVPLPPCEFIYDLVYNPARTALMRLALAAGIPVSNGFGMLVEQAGLSLERWTGGSVPRQPMFTAAPEFLVHPWSESDRSL